MLTETKSSTYQRLFFGLKLPYKLILPIKNTLNKHHSSLVNQLKWHHPEDYHITLCFLGKTPESNIKSLIKTVQEATKKVCAFSLSCKQIQVFSQSGTLVATVISNTALIELREAILETVKRISPSIACKTYTPHITLAKLNKRDNIKFTPISITPEIKTTFKEFYLYSSQHQENSNKYMISRRFKLNSINTT